jgi:uncharacterized cupin superfamily protein
MGSFELATTPLHLGLGATAVPQPAFDGEVSWYEGYAMRHSEDGAEGRLVSMHTFDNSWDVWEMHPSGSEVVLCVSGKMTLIQEMDGQPVATTVGPGQAAINPPGMWHTADVHQPTTALFITAGMGTEHRPR